MGKYNFYEHVRDIFSYLIDEYEFSVVLTRQDAAAFGNSLVEFQSEFIILRVILDRGQVLIDVGPRTDEGEFHFELPIVIDFLAPGFSDPVYIFPQEWDDYHKMVDLQLERLARIVHQYCEPILTENFRRWQEMYEVNKKQAEGVYRAITGKDPVKIVSEECQRRILNEIDERKNNAMRQ